MNKIGDLIKYVGSVIMYSDGKYITKGDLATIINFSDSEFSFYCDKYPNIRLYTNYQDSNVWINIRLERNNVIDGILNE